MTSPEKKSKKRSRDEEKNGKSSTKKKKVSNGELNDVEHVIANVDEEENKPLTNFRISRKSIEVLQSNGISTLFPIQWRLYDSVVDGNDVIGRARTGSGKTISYVLPIIERLIRRFKKVKKMKKKSKEDDDEEEENFTKDPSVPHSPYVLILAPTRELVRQVDDVIKMVGRPHGVTSTVIYGGASYDAQESFLRRGVDVIVGTPGRLIDHLERGNIKFGSLKCVVLDEADEMLNIGFKDSIEKILEFIPKEKNKHQTLLYSATIPEWVSKIAKKYLNSEHKRVDLIGQQKNKTSETVRHLAVKVPSSTRASVISDLLRVYGKGGNAIIFCDTKSEANDLGVSSSQLQDCQVIHGDIVQSQREITMDAFRNNKFRVLVATDVAARGLDIDNVDLVIQLNPPSDVENFIHRSGRTGRAGKHGINCTLYSQRFIYRLKILEREAGIKFERVGAPQPKDIYKVSAESLIDKALDVKENHETLLNSFVDVAEQMINDIGDPKIALAACIAVGCGYEEPIKQRSLLTGSEDKVTMKITLSEPIRARSFVIKSIIKAMNIDDQDFKSLGVGEIRLSNDGSAVVDVPETLVNKLIGMNTTWRSFEIVDELPELEEEVETYDFRGNGGRGGYSRGGRGNGYSRGGGGYSRGGGGYSRGGGNGYSRGGGNGYSRGGGSSRGGGFSSRYG